MNRRVEYTDLVTVHVERRLHALLSDVWELVASCPDVWLGGSVRVDPDGAFAVDRCLDGSHVHGCIEEVALLERVVLTWQPDDWDEPAVVELSLVEAGPMDTLVSIHVEDVPEHVSLRCVDIHWQAALDHLAVAASAPRAA